MDKKCFGRSISVYISTCAITFSRVTQMKPSDVVAISASLFISLMSASVGWLAHVSICLVCSILDNSEKPDG